MLISDSSSGERKRKKKKKKTSAKGESRVSSSPTPKTINEIEQTPNYIPQAIRSPELKQNINTVANDIMMFELVLEDVI
jgi:hypothetical protein